MNSLESNIKNEMKEKPGFDSPKNQKEDDELGRWAFAEELYELLSNAPKNWSVRVGVYGNWGEGKTTVLNFIYEIAKKEKQTIIRFNPWEYQSATELWESFTSLLYRKLNELNKEIKLSDRFWFNTRIRIKGWLRKPISLLEPLSKLHQYSEYGVPILKNFLSFNNNSIKRIPNLIKDKRVIVIIDDLERANPLLISQMLFVIKELLDLPGFSFILAFDPEIVNSTLKQNNVRFGEEKDFLEKIIEFPRWLPKASDNELKELIRSELVNTLDFIPFEAFDSIFNHLPKNPRKLKQFIRSFLGFKNEIDRYNKEEINWSILLLLNLLKNSFPAIADSIIENRIIWDAITTERWFGERSHNQDIKKDYEEELLKICEKNKITSNEQENIVNIINDIANSDFPISINSLDSYTYLTERKNILTWKEYNLLLLEFEKISNISVIKKHIDNLVKQTSYSKEDILGAIFYKSIEYHNWSLNMASDSLYEKELCDHTKDANIALEILRKVSFDFEGFSGTTPFLTLEHFSELYKMITRWLDFVMPEIYKETRISEKKLIIDICSRMKINQIEVMKYLEPWMPFRRNGYDTESEMKLAQELGLILEEKISEQLLEKFLHKDWVFHIFLRSEHVVEHYILLRKTSIFWLSNLKTKFLQLLEDNKDNEILQKNMYHMFSIVESTFFDPIGRWSVIKDEDSIMNDAELMKKMWEVALNNKINPRMFTSIERFRNKLKEKTGIELPTPVWWEEIKTIVNNRRSDNK